MNRRQYREEYHKFLSENEDWRECSFRVRERAGWLCQYCGETATQTHHLSYSGMYNGVPWVWLPPEPLWTIVLRSACRECHLAIERCDRKTLLKRMGLSD